MSTSARLTLVVCLLAAPLAAEDAAGLRERLAARGLTVEIRLQADHSTTLAGGLRRGSALRRPLAAAVDIDAGRLLGWRGARLHAGAQSHAGRHASDELVGDAQGFDNVDAERLDQVSEAWLEQVLLGGALRVKIGKVDAGSEFAYVENGGGFLNSSAGVSPAIQGFPTYPDPAFSVNLVARPRRGLYVAAGLYDGATQDGCHGRTGNRGFSTALGAPASAFLVGEAGLRFAPRGHRARIGLGAWRHTGTFATLDGEARRGTAGAYAVLDVQASPSVGLFAQWGHADGEVSAIDRHLAAGAAWTGPLGGREADVLGLLVSGVRLRGGTAERPPRPEVALEAYYGIAVTPWLTLKPDVQLVVNPAGRERNALVGTVRATMTF